MKNAVKQNWIPLWLDSWLFGSTRIELTTEERAVWVDLLVVGAKDEGYIRAGTSMPYPLPQLAGLLMVDEELLERTIAKCVKTDKLAVEESGILRIVNWDKYQISDRYRRKLAADDKKPPKSEEKPLNSESSSAKTEQCSEKLEGCSASLLNIRREEKRGEEKSGEPQLKLFNRESIEFQLSQLLFNLIRQNNPKFKAQIDTPEKEEELFKKWAEYIDYLMRLDKRTPTDLIAVIKWCQQDKFWKGNILSTRKLREQIDKLEIQMAETPYSDDAKRIKARLKKQAEERKKFEDMEKNRAKDETVSKCMEQFKKGKKK